MYFFYLVVAITVSIGIGAFDAHNSQQRTAYHTEWSRSEVAQVQANYMMRALRRQLQINPSALPPIPPEGTVTIPANVVEDHYFGGYRPIGLVSFVLDAAGNVVANIEEEEILFGPRDNDGLPTLETRIAAQEKKGPDHVQIALGQIDLEVLGLAPSPAETNRLTLSAKPD